MTRLFALVTAAFILGGCGTPTRVPEPAAVKPIIAPPVALPPTFPLSEFVADGMPIVINVTLGERNIMVALDTGASTSTLDQSLPEAAVTSPIFLSAGGVAMPAIETFHARDLSLLRSIVDLPIMGILGMDVMRHYTIQLDFAAHQLRFLPAAAREPYPGKMYPLLYLRNVPAVRGTLTHASAQTPATWNYTIIDTGYSGTASFGPPLFDFVSGRGTLIGLMNTLQMSGITASVVPQREARFDQLTYGSETYHDLIVGRNDYISNHWGLGFLSRHIATLDFVHDRIYMKRIAELSHREIRDPTGLAIFRDTRGMAAVYSVSHKSPAAKAGIQPGDRVLEVNGLIASEHSLWQLRRILRGASGGEVQITLGHDGAVRRVKLSAAGEP